MSDSDTPYPSHEFISNVFSSWISNSAGFAIALTDNVLKDSPDYTDEEIPILRRKSDQFFFEKIFLELENCSNEIDKVILEKMKKAAAETMRDLREQE